jgi:hypothetical protein
VAHYNVPEIKCTRVVFKQGIVDGVSGGWCGKRISFAPFYTQNASFYQDRLGTNICGKQHSKRGERCVFIFARRDCLAPHWKKV